MSDKRNTNQAPTSVLREFVATSARLAKVTSGRLRTALFLQRPGAAEFRGRSSGDAMSFGDAMHNPGLVRYRRDENTMVSSACSHFVTRCATITND